MINTGWNGTGKRISLKNTRAIIDRILDGSLESAPTQILPIYNLEIPTNLEGVDDAILDPRATYEDVSEWSTKAIDLAELFINNFKQYTENPQGQELVKFGPQL